MPRAKTKDAFAFESPGGPNRYGLTGEDLAALKVKDHYLYLAYDRALIKELESADAVGDGRKIGRLLGYPECCVEFYAGISGRSDVACINAALDNSGPGPFVFLNNVARCGKTILLHFPCSFGCEASLKSGGRYFESLKSVDADYALRHRADLRKAVFVGKDFLLNLPVERPAEGADFEDFPAKNLKGGRLALRGGPAPGRGSPPGSGATLAEVDGVLHAGRLVLFDA